MTLPEGFVLEQSNNLPEGFVLESQTPVAPVQTPPKATVSIGNFEIPKTNSMALATLGGVPLISGAGELYKGVGALTQLAFPETGAKMVQQCQD